MKQNTNRRNKILTVVLVLMLALISTFFVTIKGYTVNADTLNQNDDNYEDKIYSNVDIQEDFEEDSVLVVIDKYNSEVNKSQEHLFSNLSIVESIKDLTYKTTNDTEIKDSFRQILKICLKEKSKQAVLEAVKTIEQIEGVLWVGENGYGTYGQAPAMSGSLYKAQWGLNWSNGINVENAWKYTKGNKKVRVGIIDSGIADHEDLRANVVDGWDFYNDNAITNDDLTGHGTKVAGIIGAIGANANGIMGVCPNVQLVPLQVHINGTELTEKSKFSREAVVAAINWASNNNISILNYSGGSPKEEYVPYRAAIENYNGLFICSAGNESNDNDVVSHYPSNYACFPNIGTRVIAVGSIDFTGEIANHSNYGKGSVNLFAPGQAIWTTCPVEIDSTGYYSSTGTSFATPFVTGTAALLYSQYVDSYGLEESEIAVQVKNAILDNVTKDNRYTDKCITGGRLNAADALRNMQYRSVAEDFGLSDGNYKWQGKLDVDLGEHGYEINADDTVVIKYYSNLKFSLGTKYVFNAISAINSSISIQLFNSADEVIPIEGQESFDCQVNVGLVSNVTYSSRTFNIDTSNLPNDTYTLYLSCISTRKNVTRETSEEFTFIVDHQPAGCIAPGSLITLADGSQVAVELLKGDEMLLVWNMFTGKFDIAPIVFIDSEFAREYEVINLYFSDGTCVKVIDEHGFWDIDLNKYVYLRKDASRYIGHRFSKQTVDSDGNLVNTQVRLVDVVVDNEYTTAWSPVTYAHLCYYVNGMLSMPGGIEGLFNIFDVNPDTMTIDDESYLADVEKYGLFTYEEFSETFDIPEIAYEAFGGQYLKVAIGKGLISEERLQELIERYSIFWES